MRLPPATVASLLRFVSGCGLLATIGTVSACSQALRLPPAPSPAEIPELERRTADRPTDLQASVRLGAAYWGAGRLPEAEVALVRARELAPEHPAPVFYLGVTYEDQGRYAEAREAYRAYLERGDSDRLKSEVRARITLLGRRELEASVRAALASEAELTRTPPPPSTVGLFPFVYAGSDARLHPLGRAMAELLVTDLSTTGRLTVVERLRIQLLLDEIALAEAGAVDTSTAVRAGRILGAGRIVQGRVDGEEASLLVEALVVPAGGDPTEQVGRVADQDALRQLFDLQKRMALELYATLGVELTPAERERVLQRTTENVQALLAYGAGLEAGDSGRFRVAADHFAAAVRLDPAFEEAGAKEAEARAMDSASRRSTRELAGVDDSDLLTTFTEEDWARMRLALEDMWIYLPGIHGRDAIPEIFGTEGFGVNPFGSVEFILGRP